jgi:hypothetical protein
MPTLFTDSPSPGPCSRVSTPALPPRPLPPCWRSPPRRVTTPRPPSLSWAPPWTVTPEAVELGVSLRQLLAEAAATANQLATAAGA